MQKEIKSKSLETIFVLCVFLLVAYWFTHYNFLIVVCFFLTVTGLFSDFLSQKIHWLWMKLADVIGLVNTKIILSVLFFLVLTPLALLNKLRNKDSLRIKAQKRRSMFDTRDHLYTSKDLESPW